MVPAQVPAFIPVSKLVGGGDKGGSPSRGKRGTNTILIFWLPEFSMTIIYRKAAKREIRGNLCLLRVSSEPYIETAMSELCGWLGVSLVVTPGGR